ncbi:glycosyltransferase family 4 protein [Thermococcus sp. 18S1]|uniref:glycosyltransferase n=1 Tax=Thermococcus sp. 18S1 TaxID=1638210 RepID=UPI0014395BCC|nr:glycosyltransferase [Thermococcus sp. 18S1]NJE30328.1 glycosyltransferase family 4 protein [Thermococcus sp. 18S1]
MKVLMVGPIEKAGGVSTHTKELTKALRKLGVEVEVYNISPGREYLAIISNLIKLYKRTWGLSIKSLTAAKNFNIVHIQSSGPLGGFIPAIVGTFWSQILGLNFIVTFHYRSDKAFINKYRRIFQIVIKNSRIFFVVSDKQIKNLRDVIDVHLITHRVKLVFNGFDNELFRPISKTYCREILNLPYNKKIVVTIGNLLPVKGHEYLIEAMKKIVKARNDVMLIIVGDGPLRKDLENQIKKLGLENYVKLVGAKPHNKIPLWMNAADLFVLPSLSEGNPTVMFEALGVGLPFVGTAVGGVPEIITSEDYGLLCPPKDPECLAEKILIALDKEWNREKIRKYAEQFTWENIARETLKIYRQVLDNETQ